MNDKYFTPDKEDVYIGYECQYHGMTAGGLMIMDLSDEGKSETIKEPDTKVYFSIKCGLDPWNERAPQQIYDLIDNGQIQVPYLTKEQIEAEGWLFKIEYTGIYRLVFEKNNSILVFNPENKMISITPKDPSLEFYEHHPRYAGSCRCINEFRTICKLLKI